MTCPSSDILSRFRAPVGGTAVGGPVGGVAGGVGGGYVGGKTGKGIGRNAFNYVWGSDITNGGNDSFGRNTGFGINNGQHGNDFKPQLHDAAYLIPGAGGALTTPMRQLPNFYRNLAGKAVTRSGEQAVTQAGEKLFSPVYQSLPWAERYAYGPNTNWKYQVNLNQPTNLERWQHGRVADLDTGQFRGLSGTTPERNLRYQVTYLFLVGYK